MGENAQRIVAVFRELRTFCAEASALLQTCDDFMGNHAWEPVKNWVITDLGIALREHKRWLPSEFVRFYSSDRHPHLLAFVAINVDNRYDEEPIDEALISAGVIDYGRGHPMNLGWCHSFGRAHLWHQPKAASDGTWISIDYDSWDEEEPPGKPSIKTFAWPLDEITGREELARRVMEPLLNAVEGNVDGRGRAGTQPAVSGEGTR